MNYEFEQNCITATPTLSDFSAFRPGGELHAPALKAGQVSAAFLGSLVLLVGVDFGTKQVLPTLVDPHFVLGASLLLNLATLVLCALAVTNAAGKSEPAALSDRPDESLVKAVLAGIFLAPPGLGGALLVASGTTAAVGIVLGSAVGLVSLLAIGFTAWLAADPAPSLLSALPRRKTSEVF